jgi:hypothetical protein
MKRKNNLQKLFTFNLNQHYTRNFERAFQNFEDALREEQTRNLQDLKRKVLA